MTVGRQGGTGRIGLGFRAGKGGGVLVGVVVDNGIPQVVLSTFLPTAAEGDRLALEPYGVLVGVVVDNGIPQVVLSTFLPTAAEGDRLALEPYRVAYEMKRGPDGGASPEAVAAVAEGQKRQRDLAAEGLAAIVHKLRDVAGRPVAAAVLVGRAGWITDALAYSLAWPEHVPIAEGLAVRDAFRHACARCGLEVIEMDEKSLREVASEQLRLSSHDVDVRLKSLGATVGKPWRREQKLACLSAWVTAQ